MVQEQQLVSQSNALTSARYQLDLVEKRCLYVIIQQVRNNYVEDTIQRDLFNDMQVSIPRKELDSLTENRHKTAFNSLRNLRLREFFEEKDDDNAFSVGFINWARRTPTDYIVEVSSAFLPYLVQLASKFTTYDITFAMCLRSTYSQRFYELCCQYRRKGQFFLDVDNLRQMFNIENKYPNFAHLRKYAIDIAQKELRELYESGESDICFTYTEDKNTKIGKQVTRLWFQIIDRKATESLDYKKVDDMIRAIAIKLGEL